MDPRIRRILSPDDEARIAGAVRAVEARTAGEVIPYVVAESGGYTAVSWKGATLGALAAAAAAAIGHRVSEPWGGITLWIALPPLAGGALGYLLALIAPLRRALAGRELLRLRVEDQAQKAFLETEAFATRERTGILVFLSLFERRVVMLADRGIHTRIPHERWQQLADRVAAGVRDGHPAAALVEAIEACGALLLEQGFARRPGDVDELPDRLRTGPGEDAGG